jgi:trigger factor
MVGEVARSKAIAIALSKAKVVDEKGKAVDVSALVATVLGGEDDDSEIIEESDLVGVDHDHDDHDHEGHDH